MKVTIEKKTDQLNYEDFLGGVTRIVTIADVRKGSKEQQYDIAIEGDDRYWRPAVTVLKLLVQAWGDEAAAWKGRHAKLYGDPEVMFAGVKVGGIRVSHLSDIDGPVSAMLSETRGKRKRHVANPIPEAELRVHLLRAEYRTADTDRRKGIEAEVAALNGGAR